VVFAIEDLKSLCQQTVGNVSIQILDRGYVIAGPSLTKTIMG